MGVQVLTGKIFPEKSAMHIINSPAGLSAIPTRGRLSRVSDGSWKEGVGSQADSNNLSYRPPHIVFECTLTRPAARFSG
jgi:hypothetical protein